MGIETTKADASHTPDHSREVREVREMIRSRRYFDNPLQKRKFHKSLGGKVLDLELRDFAGLCKQNREIYLDDLAAGKTLLSL